MSALHKFQNEWLTMCDFNSFTERTFCSHIAQRIVTCGTRNAKKMSRTFMLIIDFTIMKLCSFILQLQCFSIFTDVINSQPKHRRSSVVRGNNNKCSVLPGLAVFASSFKLRIWKCLSKLLKPREEIKGLSDKLMRIRRGWYYFITPQQWHLFSFSCSILFILPLPEIAASLHKFCDVSFSSIWTKCSHSICFDPSTTILPFLCRLTPIKRASLNLSLQISESAEK